MRLTAGFSTRLSTRLSARAVLCAVVLLGTTGWFSACSSDPDSGGEDPPGTVDDILEVVGSATTALNVLGNDQDLDNEPLTIEIEGSPLVGSATVNSDNTVRLELPSGFSGVTRFRYRVTNSLGGFSISTAVVFVDVPAYRVLFAAGSNTQPRELYISDLVEPVQVSRATVGNLRLQNAWRSESGGLIAYERADPAALDSTRELYYVRTNPIDDPVRIPQPSGRAFVTSVPLVIDDADRWIAFTTVSTSGSGQAANLYVFDTSGSQPAQQVGSSGNILPSTVVWVGDQLYFMAAPNNTGAAVYRASPGSFDAPQRVSQIYRSTDAHDQLFVSPDGTRIVIAGNHLGQEGLFLVDPNTPNTERWLTSDLTAGAAIDAYELDDDVTRLTYLWRLGTSTIARLSVVPVTGTSQPDTVLEADINSFTEVRPDGVAALITRGPGGAGSDGVLWEVSLDGASSDLRIARNVTGGVYDGTGNRVYLYSRTLPPAVIERGSFDDDVDRLVRSTTPPQALFVAPENAPSAAIIEDPTLGLVLVNAAAPGETLSLTNLDVGSVPTSLLPDAIQ